MSDKEDISSSAAFIKHELQLRHLSVKTLADITATHEEDIEKMLAGSLPVSDSFAKKLEVIFGVSAAEILNPKSKNVIG